MKICISKTTGRCIRCCDKVLAGDLVGKGWGRAFYTKIRIKRRTAPSYKAFFKSLPGLVLAAALLLVFMRIWALPAGSELAGIAMPGLRELAGIMGQSALQQIWERFYPAPEVGQEGQRQMQGESDPSYRAAKTVEAFFQEHSYLALYGNEETGGPEGEEALWPSGQALTEAGASGQFGAMQEAGASGQPGAGQGAGASGQSGAGQGAGASGQPGAGQGAGASGQFGAGQEAGSLAAAMQDKVLANDITFPGQVYQLAQLEDYDFLMSHFYSVHTSTTASRELMDAKKLLRYDLRLLEGDSSGGFGQDGQPAGPQILIYHTHSQEAFADPEEGGTIVGAGDYLAELLEEKGFSVYHDRSVYDVRDGKLDRNKAYTYALEGIQKILEEEPSIQVVIDLHRDGVRSGTHLVTEVNGKPTAQIMFFNGLSQTPEGPIPYLDNPYREENLAFSLQLQLKAAAYFPGFTRKIYLKGLRYNLHLKPRSCLVEVGAQTNTYEEILNAMEPLAEVFTMVLRGN